jgi:tryptophan synthase alpha chain
MEAAEVQKKCLYKSVPNNACVLDLQATNKPVAVGFGVSTPEHVKQVD